MRAAVAAGFAAALVVPILFIVLWDGIYLMREGAYLLGLLVRARPIERLESRGAIDEATAAMFATTADIRAFAEQQLGLTSDRNFTRFVHLDRDYVATVVSAAGRFSFDRHYWNYPIFGRASYRGYFGAQDAEREAERLRRAGWDVVVRRVSAFSLLGFSADPLYSFMSDYTTYRLASLIFHEQTHSTIWLRGQVQFNEELASFVEHEGALMYLQQRYGEQSEEQLAVVAARNDRERFRQRLAALRDELEELYRSESTDTQMAEEKDRIIENFRNDFVMNYDRYFESDSYRSFAQAPINNALLDLYATYGGEIGLLYELFDAAGRDLRATIALLGRVRARADDPRGYIRDVLLLEVAEAQ